MDLERFEPMPEVLRPIRKGRPAKYSPEKVAAIVAALRNGITRTAAAGYVGINYDTFHEWVDRYPEFSEAVTRAEHEAEVMFTSAIADAARGTGGMQRDWRAAVE